MVANAKEDVQCVLHFDKLYLVHRTTRPRGWAAPLTRTLRLRHGHPVAPLAGLTVGVALLGIDFGLFVVAVGSIPGSRWTTLGVTARTDVCPSL